MVLGKVNAAVSRRPAVPAAILFILGIALHGLLPHRPILLLCVLAVLIVGAVLFIHRSWQSTGFVAIAIGLSGGISARLSEFNYAPNHIGAFATDEPRLCWIEGTVRDTPRLIEADSTGRPMPDKQVISLAVRAVRSWNGWVPATGGMPVTISPPAPDLAAGDVVQLLGRIEQPQPAMNPGAFDSAVHYRRERVLTVMHVTRPYDVRILSRAPRLTLPLVSIRDTSRRLLDRGFDQAHSADRALLRALVFGDREPAVRDVQDDFIRSGTTHLLAANGSRIAMLAALVYLLCRLLRLPPRPALAVLTCVITLFGFLTMPAAEALRPTVVCAAVGLGTIGRRGIDSLQMLSIAAVALLVPRPLDLYGAGFQLSFVIVAGLILFTGPVLRWVESFENRDKKVAQSFEPQTSSRRFRKWLRVWVIRAVVAGTVAWVAALPLITWHFEQLNPLTVPFGILLSPLAVLALGGGFFKILLTAICPGLVGAWASMANVPAACLRHAVHWLAAAPLADLPMAKPSVGMILLFYLLLFAPMIHWPKKPVRWCARLAPACGCVFVAILPLCAGFAPWSGGGRDVRVTILSVGAGQCVVVEPSGGGIVVLDCGSSSNSDLMRTCIEPFLRHEQCRSIRSIWLSHGDYDHISATPHLVPEYGAKEVITSPHFRRHAHESKPCESILAGLDQSRQSPRLVVQGDRVRIGTDAEIEVLWPPAGSTFNSNNCGLVLRLTCAGRSILFPADIQEPAERALLANPSSLRSDLLVAPHHGSAETTTLQFVRAVNPKLIVASNDSRLTKKQRIFEQEMKAFSLLRTSRCGAITIDVNRDGTFRVTPFLTHPALPIDH